MNDGGQDSGTGGRWASDLAHLPGFSPTHPGGPVKKVEDVVAANGKYWVRPEKQDGATGYSILYGDVLLATTPHATEPERIKQYQAWACKIASSLSWRAATLQFVDEQLAEWLLAALITEDEAADCAHLVGRTAREP